MVVVRIPGRSRYPNREGVSVSQYLNEISLDKISLDIERRQGESRFLSNLDTEAPVYQVCSSGLPRREE
jgi:hypothetical protein